MQGRSITISTSKIKKIIVIKKNRKEKGIRWLELLSNPHSKGEDFSRFIIVFLAKIKEKIKTIKVIIKTIGIKKINWRIIFSIIGPLDWKSRILYYTKKINFLINKLK